MGQAHPGDPGRGCHHLPVGVKHWHGAAPGSAMTHISICEEKEPGKVVEWMEPVTDEQYNGK